MVWLDTVQYAKGGWTNRNRLRDGSWLTVPVARGTDGLAVNCVRVSEHGRWRCKAISRIRQLYGRSGPSEGVCVELERPYGLLVGLNLALLRVVLDARGCGARWHFQSHLDGGNAVVAVSDDAGELLPISDRLAMMVAEVGGDVYLSGPSGIRYLDERPFSERGIEVRYFAYGRPENPCALDAVSGCLQEDERTRLMPT